MKDAALIFVKGLLMGSADVVPGVSGGTIAFITGIYDRLIDGLKDVGAFLKLSAQKLLRKSDETWKKVFGRIDFRLFIPLGLGIGIAFAIGSHIIPVMMERYPVPVYSLFIGLVLASAYQVYRQIKKHDMNGWMFALLGLALGIAISLAPIGEAGTLAPLPILFVLGAIAICAMILPGISGSYILLMFGQYAPILLALKSLNIAAIAVFMAGAAIGLLTFARGLSWLLHNYHSYTFYALLGLMVGALTSLAIIVQENAAGSASIVTSVGFIALGAALVLAIEFYAHK
jgi:putative membrane protein